MNKGERKLFIDCRSCWLRSEITTDGPFLMEPCGRCGSTLQRVSFGDVSISVAIPTASDWLPIDSAPKDGTSVLGFAGGDMAVVSFSQGYWSLVVCGSHADDGEWTPTHWQPLPEPPEMKDDAEPTYNHTRGDPPIYPCTICRGILLAKEKT